MNDAVTEVMDNAVADVTNAVGDAVPTDVTEKIGFVERYLNELPQKALNLGIRVVLALVFFFVGVQVIKLIMKDSIEEKIDALQTRKKLLSENVIEAGEVFVNQLSMEELVELFQAE